MSDTKQINFRFAKNWKIFIDWHNALTRNGMDKVSWHIQSQKIEDIFEATVPNIVDWKMIWKDLNVWLIQMYKKTDVVKWSEHQRQIETLLLNQLKDLNTEQFILVYRLNGKPQADPSTMTYWEAVRVKQNLEGDLNGLGGNEDMDNITIVNLKKLLI